MDIPCEKTLGCLQVLDAGYKHLLEYEMFRGRDYVVASLCLLSSIRDERMMNEVGRCGIRKREEMKSLHIIRFLPR